MTATDAHQADTLFHQCQSSHHAVPNIRKLEPPQADYSESAECSRFEETEEPESSSSATVCTTDKVTISTDTAIYPSHHAEPHSTHAATNQYFTADGAYRLQLTDERSLAKRAADKVLAPELRLGADFLRAFRDPIIYCTAAGEIDYHNAHLIETLGYAKGTLCGHSLYDLFPYTVRQRQEAELDGLIAGERQLLRTEWQIRGHLCSQSLNVLGLRKSEDPDSPCYLIFSQAHQSLINFQNLVEHTPHLVWVSDLEHRLVYMNQSSIDFFGLSEAPTPYQLMIGIEFHCIGTPISNERILTSLVDRYGRAHHYTMARALWLDDNGDQIGWTYHAI